MPTNFAYNSLTSRDGLEPSRLLIAENCLKSITCDLPSKELKQMGFSVEYKSLSVPGVSVKGRIEIDRRKVYLDPEGLKDLTQEILKNFGTHIPCTLAEEIVLAHELFHLKNPQLNGQVSEETANIFAFLYLQLNFIPTL